MKKNGGMLMTGALAGLGVAAVAWALSAGTTSDDKIGLACFGKTHWPAALPDTASEEHYVVDRLNAKIIHRDPHSAEIFAEYVLTTDKERYNGERQEDGRTNAGFATHRFETVSISRDDGAIEYISHSTTSFPDGPVTQTTRFTGQCEAEDPNAIVEKAETKF